MVVAVVAALVCATASPTMAQPLNTPTATVLQAKKTVVRKKTGLYKIGKKWKYYKNGKFTKVTGLVKNTRTNKWVYVKNGVWKKSTGVVKRVGTKKYYYIKNGVLAKKTGLAKRLDTKKWVYVKKGVFTKFTGIAKKIGTNKSFYVKKGKLNTKTGAVKYNGTYYDLKNGKATKHTKHIYGEWTLNGDQLTHTCTVCGKEETQPYSSFSEMTDEEFDLYYEAVKNTDSKEAADVVRQHYDKIKNDPEYFDTHEQTADNSYQVEIATPATCTEEGVKTYTFADGDNYEVNVAMLKHNWVKTQKTIHHDDVYEDIDYRKDAVHERCDCGVDVTLYLRELGLDYFLDDYGTRNPNYDRKTRDDAETKHHKECGHGGSRTFVVSVPNIVHELVTPAYDETITEYICSECGATK